MTKVWNPVAEPFRVGATYRSTAAGLYGWRDGPVQTFATIEEARAAAAAIPRDRTLRSISIQVAVNPETWQRNGRWRTVK
jgi:hypothetical protein